MDAQVSVAKFTKWGEVRDLVADEVLDESELKDMIKEVVGGKKTIDFDAFYSLVAQLDELVEGEEDGEDGESYDEDDDDDDDDEGEELAEAEMRAFAEELYDGLRGEDAALTVAKFKKWSEVDDLIGDKIITEADLNKLIKESGGNGKLLTFEQFYDVMSVLETAGEEEGEEDEGFEILDSTKGFSKGAASEGGDEGDEEDDDGFDELSSEEVDELLTSFYDELKGPNGKVSRAAFLKWEEVQEMLSSGAVAQSDVDACLADAGVKKGGDLSYEQFKEAVTALDELVEGQEGEEDDYAMDDLENLDGDGEDMTPEELAQMTKDLFDTLRGSKKTVSVKTFLAWDDVLDMQTEGLLDDDTLDALLAEVGVGKGRSGELSYEQFAQLVQMLEETAAALGDVPLEDDDGGDRPAARGSSGGSSGDADDEEEGDLLEGLDEAGVEEVARELYADIKGSAKELTVKAFKQWDDVKEILDDGVVQEATLDILISEVGSDPKKGVLTFEQFWQLVNLLEEAADAASGAGGDAGDDDEEEEEDGEEEGGDGEEYADEPSAEELEAMAREMFDELKNPKTDKVTVKKLKNWDGIKEVMDSGELSKGAFNSAIKAVGADKTNEMDFKQFAEFMDLLEASMDGEDDEDDEEDAPPAAGKGFGAKPAAPAKAAAAAPAKGAREDGSDSEVMEITKELFDDLRGKRKTLSVDALKAWDEMREMIDSGSLKRSTLEKALVKVGSYESGEITLQQFTTLIDIIQGAVDESKLSYEYEEEEDGGKGGKGFQSSTKTSVLGGDDDDADGEDTDGDYDDGEEVSEEEAARQIFEDLSKGTGTVALVDFLKWEDIQELLECGALSKDSLATAIENVGVSVDASNIAFEQFYDLLQVVDEFVDREKLPLDQSDLVFENKIEVGGQGDLGRVMTLVDGLLDGDDDDEDGETDAEDGDEDNDVGAVLDSSGLKISYIKGDQRAEGSAAIAAMQQDLEEQREEEEEDDEEVLEMFDELSKGKDYITEKALRNWDELKELVEAELASKEVIDSYLSRIEIKDGKVSLDAFRHFMSMLDMVLVDESGNFVDDASKAVDVGALEDYDDDDEEGAEGTGKQ